MELRGIQQLEVRDVIALQEVFDEERIPEPISKAVARGLWDMQEIQFAVFCVHLG